MEGGEFHNIPIQLTGGVPILPRKKYCIQINHDKKLYYHKHNCHNPDLNWCAQC